MSMRAKMVNSTLRPSVAIYIDYYKLLMLKKQGSNHPHLLVKGVQERLKSAGIDLRKLIKQMNIDYYQLDKHTLKDVLKQVIEQVTSSQDYQSFQEAAHQQITEQMDSLYSTDSKKHTYLVDCLREATAFPFLKQREAGVFNWVKIYRRNISRQLRRVVWLRQFNRESYRKQYSLVDRQVTPYNVMEELKIGLEKLAAQEGIKIKQNQKDLALRVMQYFVKVSSKIPHRYHNYLALIVVDLFSFYTLSKVIDVGAVVLGLIGLSESYRQANVEVRFQKIMKAIRIVDQESALHIESHYSESAKKELNQSYQYFRLTFGSSHLSISISQYIIDQLIVRQFCSFDMYVLFAIMVLITSDEFDSEQKEKPTLKDIIRRSKEIVKLNDFVEAFSTIYEQIPAIYSVDDMSRLSNNKLFLQMILEGKKQEQQEDDDFVIDVKDAVRIGNL